MLVSITGEPDVPINTDCSTNILYLTDDAGLVNQSDTGSDPYLSTDSRYRQISSIAELERHFSKCSRTFFELSLYFSWPVGNRIRPQTITVAYFDSANESMAEAVQDIYTCYKCFYTLTHTAYDANNAALFDTAAQLELAEWATTYFVRAVLPTADAVLTNPTENSSNAYTSKQENHTQAVYQWLNEECVPVLNADCEETDVIENIYGAQHLLMAGVISSVSMSSGNALFNVHAAPTGGIALNGLSTARLTETETWNVTGDNLHLGGVQPLHPHHVNVYHNISNYRILLSGLSATSARIDELVYMRYMRDVLNDELMSLLASNQSVPMRNDSLIKAKLTSVIRAFVAKGIIPDTAGALDKTGFDPAYLEGNGWILTRDNLTDKSIKSRVYPAFRFCYSNQDLTNYFSISVCEGV
jgi:hypothetical protein